MNAVRRQKIKAQRLLLIDVRQALEECMEEESDYLDNMPESIQGGAKGEKAQAAVDQLQEAVDSLEEAAASLEAIE